MSRISWHMYSVMLAKTAALRSEDPFTQVGAAAFDKDWHTLGTYYNGLMPKQKVDDDFWLNRDRKNIHVIHAENWLVSKTKSGEVFTVGLTHSPCLKCAVLLAMHGVKQVFFEALYHRETTFQDIFDFYKVKWEQVEIKNK